VVGKDRRIGGRCFAAGAELAHYPGAWSIWKHCNNCVFNAARPSIEAALSLAKKEAGLWVMAGARGLSSLAVRGGGWVSCWDAGWISLALPPVFFYFGLVCFFVSVCLVAGLCECVCFPFSLSFLCCVCVCDLSLCMSLSPSFNTMIHSSPVCSRNNYKKWTGILHNLLIRTACENVVALLFFVVV
jgi:hypothetical protein